MSRWALALLAIGLLPRTSAAQPGDAGRRVGDFVVAQVAGRASSGTTTAVAVEPFGLVGLDAEGVRVWAEEAFALEASLLQVPGLRLYQAPSSAAFLVSGEVRPALGGYRVQARVIDAPGGYILAGTSFTFAPGQVLRAAPPLADAGPAPLLARFVRKESAPRRATWWAGGGMQTDAGRYHAAQGTIAGRLDDRWQASLRLSRFTVERKIELRNPSGVRRGRISDQSAELVLSRVFRFARVWLPRVGVFSVDWAVVAGPGVRWDYFWTGKYEYVTPPLSSTSDIYTPGFYNHRFSPVLDAALSWRVNRALELEAGAAWAFLEQPEYWEVVRLPAVQLRLGLNFRLL